MDTNIWVARAIADHTFHERAQAKLNELAEAGELFYISAQIAREFISICSLGHNLSRPLTWEELQEQLKAMLVQAIVLNESENIDQITQPIVERFHPLRLILFGSHARGEARHENSK
jgi:predicted nucleic acid-binding protein